MYRSGARLGPYVLLELLLPGGTLFALLLFLYQRRKLTVPSLPTLIALVSPTALMTTLGTGVPPAQAERKAEKRPESRRGVHSPDSGLRRRPGDHMPG
jgi:hypothetical protein